MKIGQFCIPSKEALEEIKRRTQADGDWFSNPTPQPVTQIGVGHNDGWVMLAFPFWWWREEELIVVDL